MSSPPRPRRRRRPWSNRLRLAITLAASSLAISIANAAPLPCHRHHHSPLEVSPALIAGHPGALTGGSGAAGGPITATPPSADGLRLVRAVTRTADGVVPPATSEAAGPPVAAGRRRPAAPPRPTRSHLELEPADPRRSRPPSPADSHSSSSSGAETSSIAAATLVRGGASEGGGNDGPGASAATAATGSVAAGTESQSVESSHPETVSRILSTVRRWMDEKGEREREEREESRPLPPLPFVTLSYAQTLDGMIGLLSTLPSSSGGRSSNLPISGAESMVLTHALRSVHDAVLVGCGTMLADDPRLTVRLWGGDEDEGRGRGRGQPRPVVLDTELRCLLGPSSGSGSSSSPPRRRFRVRDVIVCCCEEAAEEYRLRRRRRITAEEGGDAAGCDGDDDGFIGGGDCWTLLPCRRRRDGGGLDLADVLRRLRSVHGIRSVMVEGGSSVLSSFVDGTVLDGGGPLVDCLCVTISPAIMGGKIGLHAFRDVGFGGVDLDDVDGGRHRIRRLGDISFDVLGSDCVLLGRWPGGGGGRT